MSAKERLVAASRRLMAIEESRDFNSPAHKHAETEYLTARDEYEASRQVYAGTGPRYVLG